MNSLLIGLLSAIVATNQPAAVSNLVHQQIGVAVEIPDTSSPVEQEFQKVMLLDDEAAEEVDKWILENQKFAAEGAGVDPQVLNQRIRGRLKPVRQAYEDFIERHPNHVRARLAFASFLDDLHDEDAVFEQLEVAKKLDPENPAIWNNLANYHGHRGDPKLAFEYYAKAIALNSNESVYYHNFGTTVFLFRKDAKEFYDIDEQQVFDKALDLYSHALKLDPDNFPLATDVAQTYYGIKPLRTNDALICWTNAMNTAHNEVEREGVHIHMARIKMLAGQYDEATNHLNLVTNENFAEVRNRVARAIQRHIEEDAGVTNATESATDNLTVP